MLGDTVPAFTEAKPVSEVGGVVGGVIGSMPELDGDAASRLSSVRLSGASREEDAAEEPERLAERREAARLSPADRWDW